MLLRNIKSARAASLLVMAVTSFLGGCASPDGEFPSLARRPYETDDPISEPENVAQQIATSIPPALAGRIAQLEARHEKAQAAYQKALPATQSVATRSAGAATGSEAWANANVQISRLDYARADSVKVVGEIDALVSAQREADSESGDPAVAPLMEKQQKAIADDVERQDSEINRLAALLGA